EFAHIAGPGVRSKHPPGRIAQLRIRARVNGTKDRKKMFREREDIDAALTKRRNLKSEDVQPEIKVFAKAAGFHRGGKIDIGKSNQARFDVQGFCAAESLECSFLQDPEKFPLRCGRERGDFIENYRAIAAQFGAPQLAFDRPCKSTSFLAERFALHNLRRKAGPIGCQRRGLPARADLMKRTVQRT